MSDELYQQMRYYRALLGENIYDDICRRAMTTAHTLLTPQGNIRELMIKALAAEANRRGHQYRISSN